MASLVEGWRATIDAVLAEVVPDEPVALVGYPGHRNAGDDAIWLEERAALRRIGRDVRYRAAWDGCSLPALRRRIGDGPVLLNGGGNFGDLYQGQQGLRERLLAEARGHPIVQLPQSIWFHDPANLERVRRLVGDHGRVTILCRDRRSEALARDAFDADVRYCPDMVLAAAPVPRPAPPSVEVLWLARRDPEAVHAAPAHPRVEVLDWLEPLPGEGPWPAGARLAWEVDRRLRRRFTGSPRLADRGWWLAAPAFDVTAAGWVARARRLLARGRVVVTDRLHAHVLALGMGIPSVVLDSSYGKVHAIARECTAASPLTVLAGTPDEALERALTLAGAA